MAQPDVGLWRNGDFLRLWTAQTISTFGSLITRTALPFTAALVLDARPAQMALLVASDMVPALLVGLVVGVWVDRLRRRPLMIAADIARALVLGSVPLAFLLGRLHIEQLYLVALVASILTILFDVSYESYLPGLVGRDKLVEANSKVSATASVAEISAFGIGGWLVQIFTGPIAVLIDAVTFIVSAALLTSIRIPERAVASQAAARSAAAEIAEGLRTVGRDSLLRPLVGSLTALELGFGLVSPIIYLYTLRELGFHPGVLGMIFAVGGISSLGGALLASPLARRIGVGPSLIGCLALAGAGILFLPLARGASLVAAGFLVAQQLVGDGAATAYEINQVSLRQRITPDRLLGRVSASSRFAGVGGRLVGTLAAGVLGQAIGLRATLIIAALAVLAGSLALVASPVRHARAVPATAS